MNSQLRIRRAFMLLIMFCVPALALAQSFTVNDPRDLVDADPTDSLCLTALNTCTLRAALNQGHADPNVPLDIVLPAGVFQITIPGRDEDAGFSGDFDVDKEVSITGMGANFTVIEGLLNDRVFDVRGSLVLGDLAVSLGAPGNSDGGGLRVIGSLSANDCRIEDNRAVNGAGIHFLPGPDGGQLTLSRCTVRQNRIIAIGQGGAGVFAAGPVTLTDVTIGDNGFNTNVFGSGGGLLLSRDAGGMRPLADLLRVNISNNGSTGFSPESRGAGIRVVHFDLVLRESLVSGNSVGTGGGGGLELTGATLFATNTTISGNSAFGPGGGILGSEDSAILLQNSTVTDNFSAGGGGGLGNANLASFTMRNSVVSGNRGAPSDCDGTLASQGFNVLGSTVGCTLTFAQGDFVGVDPRLGPLSDNGGPTRSHVPLPGSLLIDRLGTAQCTAVLFPGASASPLTLDQRGAFRPQTQIPGTTSFCDIGAVELVGRDIFKNSFEFEPPLVP